MTSTNHIRNRFVACAVGALIACGLMVPATAFAEVSVDGQALNQGENAVGGGTATLSETVLDMVNVVAETMSIDQGLTVNFNGGNEIDGVAVTGSAEVEMNFTGENEVEDIAVGGKADLTINADGHNEFEEVYAFEDSNLTINVAGENEFEEIKGYDNANITVRGVTCQKRDVIELGDDEDDTEVTTNKGNLIIDHVTFDVKAKSAWFGSEEGDMKIDTSKIGKGDGNEDMLIAVYDGALEIYESVIDMVGSIFVDGKLTINHSDVKVVKPDESLGYPPHRIFATKGIELIDEKNGEVKEGKSFGLDGWYVDTGDGDDVVDLKADGEPAYYRCKSDDSADTKGMPKTGDGANVPMLMLTFAGALTVALASRRRVRGAHAK